MTDHQAPPSAEGSSQDLSFSSQLKNALRKQVIDVIGDGARGLESKRLSRTVKLILDRLLKEAGEISDSPQVRAMLTEQVLHSLRTDVEQIVTNRCEHLNESVDDLSTEEEGLAYEVADEMAGFGPLDVLMENPDISDILINGPHQIYVEMKGRLERTSVSFRDTFHLQEVVDHLIRITGKEMDPAKPLLDGRLPDGSRINIVLPPLGVDGILVSIRRFGKGHMGPEVLIEKGTITQEMSTFFAAVAQSGINILISGGTGAGKTTLLNMLSGFISPTERITTIEDAAELRLQQPHVVRMETRAGIGGGSANARVETRDLLRNALRMRPDRIIVGECRGPEALDMLQAMNTGHDGSITTLHANSPRDALSRIETMVSMAGYDMPAIAVRRQIVSAVQLIIQVSRLHGGVRRVTQVSEITGMEGDIVSMQDIYVFSETGLDDQGKTTGHFWATGIRPRCINRAYAAGIHVPNDIFKRRMLDGDGSQPPVFPDHER